MNQQYHHHLGGTVLDFHLNWMKTIPINESLDVLAASPAIKHLLILPKVEQYV